VAWYLPVRKLVSDVSIVAQYRTEEIPATIKAFRKLDYTDEPLFRSGFLRNAIESHFWLLKNSGKSLDSVLIEMKISIDSMMTKLIKDKKKLSEIWASGNLFDKHKLQHLLFPNGFAYDKQNGQVLTFRTNVFFDLTRSISTVLSEIKNGDPIKIDQISARVTLSGFKPETS
jgi:hypothetical protein